MAAKRMRVESPPKEAWILQRLPEALLYCCLDYCKHTEIVIVSRLAQSFRKTIHQYLVQLRRCYYPFVSQKEHGPFLALLLGKATCLRDLTLGGGGGGGFQLIPRIQATMVKCATHLQNIHVPLECWSATTIRGLQGHRLRSLTLPDGYLLGNSLFEWLTTCTNLKELDIQLNGTLVTNVLRSIAAAPLEILCIKPNDGPFSLVKPSRLTVFAATLTHLEMVLPKNETEFAVAINQLPLLTFLAVRVRSQQQSRHRPTKPTWTLANLETLCIWQKRYNTPVLADVAHIVAPNLCSVEWLLTPRQLAMLSESASGIEMVNEQHYGARAVSIHDHKDMDGAYQLAVAIAKGRFAKLRDISCIELPFPISVHVLALMAAHCPHLSLVQFIETGGSSSSSYEIDTIETGIVSLLVGSRVQDVLIQRPDPDDDEDLVEDDDATKDKLREVDQQLKTLWKPVTTITTTTTIDIRVSTLELPVYNSALHKKFNQFVFPALRELRIQTFAGETLDHLAHQFGSSCQELYISNAPVLDRLVSTPGFCRLQNLSLHNCPHITDHYVIQLVRSGHLSKLESLELVNCTQLTFPDLLHDFSSSASKTKALSSLVFVPDDGDDEPLVTGNDDGLVSTLILTFIGCTKLKYLTIPDFDNTLQPAIRRFLSQSAFSATFQARMSSSTIGSLSCSANFSVFDPKDEPLPELDVKEGRDGNQ